MLWDSLVDKEMLSEAYIKLKSNIYYDTTELFQRRQLSEFETEILADHSSLFNKAIHLDIPFGKSVESPLEKKFDKIVKAINTYDRNPAYFNKLLAKIDTVCLPKTFVKKPEDDNFITNQRIEEEYEISKVTIFGYLPIELHLIGVLWLMNYGYKLDAGLDNSCLGNRLLLNRDKSAIIRGSALFKPYFKQYQNWRDEAVLEAQRKLDSKNNIAFINLDLKDYFYSVRIDFKIIEDEIWGKDGYKSGGSNVHEIFKKIHTTFSSVLGKKSYPHKEMESHLNGKCVLPIGFASSYVLGNWYLKEFDKRIKKLIPNVYYSRYVDDILMVIENPDPDFHDREKCDSIRFSFDQYKKKEVREKISFTRADMTRIEQFLLETLYPVVKLVDVPAHFVKSVTASGGGPVKSSSTEKIFRLTCIQGAYFQTQKTLVYYFAHDESTAVIDKLKQELEERASEFRDFPEEDPGNESFDEQAYHLIFDGTEGKIRTLKDYKENRYGLSVFLANRIFAALRCDRKKSNKENRKILKLFKGLNNLEHFRLWEKIFTYFLINEDRDGFVEFYKHTVSEIDKILVNKPIQDSKVSHIDVATGLVRYFDIAVEMALALNPKFIDKDSKYYKEIEIFLNSKVDHMPMLLGENFTTMASFQLTRLRRCNLIRHHYVAHPLLNFSMATRQVSLNLVDRHLPQPSKFKKNSFQFSQGLTTLSPRRVKFWECCIAVVNEVMLRHTESFLERNDDRYRYSTIFSDGEGEENWILQAAYKLYAEINWIHYNGEIPHEDQIYVRSVRNFYSGVENPVSVTELTLTKENKFEKSVRISVANTNVEISNIEASIKGKPVLTEKRYDVFAKLLKETRKEKADVFLLPEFAVPYEFVSSIAKFSDRNNIAVVTGLEHWMANNLAYNFIVTVLPIEINGASDAIVLYRLKNHYAHVEELIIRGFGYEVPKPTPYRYELINWRNLYFTSFYCYELANAFHRSLFKARIDLLVASEWNKDVPYFSNIVESLSRDLHCYIGQVNTSKYGDSRLTQPSETAIKDILKLKGGINDAVLIGTMDLHKLREFQLKSYERTKSDYDDSFKPVPPDWNRKDVWRRINNESILASIPRNKMEDGDEIK
jgi:hypothetical protein